MRFLIDSDHVWWGSVGTEGMIQNVPVDSSDSYYQWSRCVSDFKGGRGDDSFALWVLRFFQ